MQRSLWGSTPSELLLGLGRSDAPTDQQENTDMFMNVKNMMSGQKSMKLAKYGQICKLCSRMKQQIFH